MSNIDDGAGAGGRATGVGGAGEEAGEDSVLLPVERGLYREALQAAAYFGVPVEEWVGQAVREKLAAEPIRPPLDSAPGPVRTPYVEAGVTTRDSRSSAG
jgi:hypothetical protein